MTVVTLGLCLITPIHCFAKESSPASVKPSYPSETRTPAESLLQLSNSLDTEKERNRELLQINHLLNQNLLEAKSKLYQKYIEAELAHYDYQIDMMNVTKALYDWQHMASNVILFLVVLVVLAGVAFSGLQLWKAVSQGGPQSTTELELSATKFRITSSIVGIVVLSLSLVFLYLFVLKVYTIRPIS
jgi:hypothetical protein